MAKAGKRPEQDCPEIWPQNKLVYEIFMLLNDGRDWAQITRQSKADKKKTELVIRHRGLPAESILKILECYNIHGDEAIHYLSRVRKLDNYYLSKVNK